MTHPFSDRKELVARAIERTGYTDFGQDDSWQEGLERLLSALSDKEYLPGAVDRIEARFTDALTARLQVESWITDHPDATAEDIEGPVIIIGLPRTATTALQNLLSCDPHWRYVRGWEAEQPIPPPNIQTEDDDPRALAERERLARDTSFAGMHIHDAGGPVDDGALLRLGFRNQELGVPAFAYTQWWRDCDMSSTYAYHHKMLRLLQHRRPPVRWLIKAPWHNFHLDQLLAEYPDARFIVTHREPVRTIPSVCSLLLTAFSGYQPREAIDRDELGRFLLNHLQISIARLMDVRQRIGDERFFDLHHQAFNSDPMGQVERIYSWLGAPLSPDARSRMTTWSEQNRSGARGNHRYEAADFGLNSNEIRTKFLNYTDRYNIT